MPAEAWQGAESVVASLPEEHVLPQHGIPALSRTAFRGDTMFSGDFTLLALLVFGLIALFIGMGIRDRNPGILLMGVGFLAVLLALIRKAVDTFG